MNIRTVEELTDVLNKDFAWRKKELSQVKSQVESKNVSEQKHKLFLRSGICILYAHWEGFVKLASNSYLEYVSMRKLPYNQLANNFVALAMKEKLKEVQDTNKPSLYIPVCDFFLFKLNERSYLPKDVISTASNLSSGILKEITLILGLDFSFYSTKSKLIDEKLLKSRNEIGHGQYLLIDRQEYLELHQEVINLLEIFRNQIENACIQKKYMKT